MKNKKKKINFSFLNLFIFSIRNKGEGRYIESHHTKTKNKKQPNPLILRIWKNPSNPLRALKIPNTENCVVCSIFCTQFSVWRTATQRATSNAVIHN